MRTEITSGPEAGSGVPKASATGAAQLQTAAGPTRGGTAGLQQRLFPCLLWQGTKHPSLPRQLKAEADNPSAGCRGSSLPGSRTSTDTARFLITQPYLDGQHSDGKGSRKVHVGLKGVQDHGVAALGRTKHGEKHGAARCVALAAQPSCVQEVLSDPGTESVAPSHSPTQPHSKAGRNQRDSGREGKVLLQWNGSNPHTQALTDQEEL